MRETIDDTEVDPSIVNLDSTFSIHMAKLGYPETERSVEIKNNLQKSFFKKNTELVILEPLYRSRVRNHFCCLFFSWQ